ncbi:hypothetical protein [Methylophaga sp.]|uniref:hypothetical protein n=1 Tax=Methylophaga sp. TaxID=2024840 RepID=UPI003A8D9CDC
MASKYSIALVGDASGAVRAVKATSTEVDKLNKDLEKSDGLFVDVRNNLNSIGTIAAASLAGVATAAGLFTQSTISQAAEVERLSAISNSASDEFQKYAASARLLGVEQDKLADIFKDTNDKVGDFLQTGGGPLKDFFDNIAPQVGVTAEQFKKLSGPQALELYVSSLERAGVSQNEMTFFMEALASDATLLLPLLQNNAEGFRVLGESVEEAGAIMDGKTIAAAQQLNATLFLLDQGTEGFKNQLRAEMIPVLSDLAVEFFDVSTNSAIAEVAADALGGTIKGITGIAVGAVATFDLLGKSLGALYATADGLFDGVTVEDFLFSPNLVAKLRSNADKAKEVFTLTTDDLSETALAYADTLDNIFSAGEDNGDGASNGVNQKIQDIVELQSKLRESIGQNKGGVSLSPIDKESVKEIDKARTSLEGLEQSLQQQVDTFGLSETAVLQYRLTTGDLSDEVQKLGAEGENLVSSILAQSEAMEQLNAVQEEAKKETEANNRLREEGISLTESMRTAQQIHNDEIDKYTKLLEKGHIDQETFNRAVAESDKSFEKAKKGMNEMSVFADQAARNMQDAFADFLFDPFDGGIKGMAKGFINSLRRMASEAAASQIFDLIKDSAVSSGIGASISGFFGFADGGVMTSQGALPLKTYSTGGVANSPQLALYGEGRLPEAYVPLPDGRSIPVTVDMGSMAPQSQAGQTTVIVNVDAKGTSVEGYEKQSKQLGERFGQMIRSVLIDEKRPGGLLNS